MIALCVFIVFRRIGFDEVVIALQGTLRGIQTLTGGKVDAALVDAVEAKRWPSPSGS